MADNSYKLEFTLSNGRIINAGTIVAPQGEAGKNGVTFTPAVAENGDISWTNDGGLDNPQTVNIKGATGATPNIVANATVDENVGVPEVNVTKTGTNENPKLTFNFRNLRGKDAEIPSELTDHLTDYSNPHKTTAEQVGAVPVDFRSFSAAPKATKNFRQSAELFVGNNGNGLRMTLQDVKNMGTKIVTVNDIKEADFDNLDVGDYIYSKI